MSVLDFTLGADPEFTCVRRGSIVSANNFCRDDGKLGCDGNGVTFEIRPSPFKEPLDLTNEIREILKEHCFTFPEFRTFDWHAGGEYGGYAMGGHVHLGIKEANNNWLVSMLDNYFGAIMVLAEDRKQGLARRRIGYGTVSEFRTQSHGIEYRAISSWLTSPYIAVATLSLAKTVAFEAMTNKTFEFTNYLLKSDFSTMNTDKLYSKFPEIWASITKMAQYQKYKPFIDILYFIIKNKLTWFPNCSMKHAWGIYDGKDFSNCIPMDVIWSRFLNK